ncbi:MAG: ABC transporter substrate-binding protein [Comamonadaceae bacterium]|nr:ABC transporter substrate-binding protein [Comamonadaceae bacterium]
MWNRRGLLGAGMTLMGAGMPVAWTQITAPVGKVIIAVEQRASFCYLPLTIAERKGFFAAEGLDVTVRELPEPGEALLAVQSGAAHVLSGPYSTTITQQIRGHPQTAFVLQGRAPQMVLGVSLRAMAHYRELRDLRGRRIGVMAQDSASDRIARLLLARAGLAARNEVQFVRLATPTEALTAFHSGGIDAICYNDPTITQLEQSGALRVIADTRTVRGCTEVFGGPMPAGCLSAPSAFVAGQAKTCQALTDAVVHGLKWLQTAGPSDIIKTVPEHYFLGDRALYLAAFSRAREAWTPDGMMPVTGPETAASMLAKFDNSGGVQRVDLARTFTNEFARKAKARFKA